MKIVASWLLYQKGHLAVIPKEAKFMKQMSWSVIDVMTAHDVDRCRAER